MKLDFEGEVVSWRGPAPFVFIAIPIDLSQKIKEVAQGLSYGWGVIPVTAALGRTTWTTSLMPKDGRYLVPVKVVVQRAESVAVGTSVTLTLELG